MKSSVHRDDRDDWKAYIRKLMAAPDSEDPTDEDIRPFDLQRSNKRVSKATWMSRRVNDRTISTDC